MQRVDVYAGQWEHVGWFDYDKCEVWRTDDDNERLCRTHTNRRWALVTPNKYGNGVAKWISGDDAKKWMIDQGWAEEAKRLKMQGYFDEPVTKPVGRPEVGPAVLVRFPADLLESIDLYAETKPSLSRAEAIRQLVKKGLGF